MRFSIAAAAALVSFSAATDHVVVVGKDNLTFVPDNILAVEGDTVTFKFWPKNHSVAQAAFNSPCQPVNNGFWSGFIPSSDKAAETEYMYTVTNASRPIWFYCTQGKHCQSGMVGVINGPASGNTLTKFKEASKNVTNNVSPITTAGAGGMLMTNGSMSMGGNTTTTPNAASSLSAPNSLAFAGLLGAFVYLML